MYRRLDTPKDRLDSVLCLLVYRALRSFDRAIVVEVMDDVATRLREWETPRKAIYVPDTHYGDAIGHLAREGIPTFSREHEDISWTG